MSNDIQTGKIPASLVSGKSQQTDELTGLSSISVIDPTERPAAGKDIRPAVALVDDAGELLNLAGTNVPAHYFLPANAILSLTDGSTQSCTRLSAYLTGAGEASLNIA